MKLSFSAKLIVLLIIGLIVVFVIDPLDPSTISTPFMLGIILMGLSLRQSTFLVATISVIYSVLTILALVHAQHYFAVHVYASPHPYFWLFQRMGLFIVVCSMAVYLAYYQSAAERTRTHLQDILSKLPAPVAISDATGVIIDANDALCAAFKQPATEIIGKRYVEHFLADIHEGKAMRYYIDIFSGQDTCINEIRVHPFGSPTPMTARLICVGTGPSRVMITLLSNREETAQDVASNRPQQA